MVSLCVGFIEDIFVRSFRSERPIETFGSTIYTAQFTDMSIESEKELNLSLAAAADAVSLESTLATDWLDWVGEIGVAPWNYFLLRMPTECN